MNTPLDEIYTIERDHYLRCFCSFMTVLAGKRLNLPNVFLLLLKNKNYRDVFKMLIGAETDYEIFLIFIQFEPSLAKSKYISKYLNATEVPLVE
tara:strand:+ start:9638 stop:9919 length:282 start_codon:yes stop_codon:yes gene_type:complete